MPEVSKISLPNSRHLVTASMSQSFMVVRVIVRVVKS